ncbi:hypothetical protein, partial [Klebsiella michiganensis]|uniref:hypothetical protein n=1 Tax=Klebsiella michiganensis TaxID=1134687 RepID=UPI001CCFD72F
FRPIRAGSELDGQHPQPEAIKLVILLKRKDRGELQGNTCCKHTFALSHKQSHFTCHNFVIPTTRKNAHSC